MTKFKLKMQEMTEEQIQTAFVKFCRYQSWGKYLLSIPNQFPFYSLPAAQRFGYLNQRKAMGMLKGASDLFLALPRSKFSGCWIEIKKKDGVASPEQLEFLKLMRETGYYTILSDDLNELMQLTVGYINA